MKLRVLMIFAVVALAGCATAKVGMTVAEFKKEGVQNSVSARF